MDVSNDQLQVHRETLTLSADGWLNFAAEYTTSGPEVNVVIDGPQPDLQVWLQLHAGL